MKSYVIGLQAALSLAAGLFGASANVHSAIDTVEAHMAAAKAAAETEYAGVLQRLCISPDKGPTTDLPGPAPDRSQWLTQPVKVFDNLYFVGTIERSAWAVTTSNGIILVDTTYDYTVEDAVIGGLKKLDLDPAKVKYAIVTHGHNGHVGGAKYLQEKFRTRIVMSAAEWDVVEQSPRDPIKPKRDMVASDGQKLTLGDTTVTLYLTPGHTPGTISTLIPVKDGGRSRLAAEWGGTAFTFEHTPQNFQTYITSVKRFADIVAKASADTLIANLTVYDGSNAKLPAVLKRKPGEPHPYVVGTDSVLRYLKVTEECAELALLRSKQRGR